MYYVLLKRFGENIYKCLGIYKDFHPNDEYKELSERTLDTTYVYLKINNLSETDLEPQKTYDYIDGEFILYERKEPNSIDYESPRYITEMIDDFNNVYNVDTAIGGNLLAATLDVISEKKRDSSKRRNHSKVFWICGPSGYGKSYTLSILGMLTKRPYIIIDCNDLKTGPARFIDQEIYERLLDAFGERDRDYLNNALIMLDNVDCVKPNDMSIEDYLIHVQRLFTDDHGSFPIYSYKYGHTDVYIRNANIVFTSTLTKDIYEKDSTDYQYFLKYIDGYRELPFNKKTCVNYLKCKYSCVRRMKELFKAFGTDLYYTPKFYDELIDKVIELGEGYPGFNTVLNSVINLEDMRKYKSVIFHDLNNIECKGPNYKVLRNVR